MRLSLLLPAAWLVLAPPLRAQVPDSTALATGAMLFESQCTRCHGIGGTGGVGPALNRPKLRRAATDDDLVKVILGGAPGTAMVGFWNLSEEEGKAAALYIPALGQHPPEVLSGAVVNGWRLYQEWDWCGLCHILSAEGVGGRRT